MHPERSKEQTSFFWMTHRRSHRLISLSPDPSLLFCFLCVRVCTCTSGSDITLMIIMMSEHVVLNET